MQVHQDFLINRLRIHQKEKKKFQNIFEDSETGSKRPATGNEESNQGGRSTRNQETMKAAATAVTLALDPMGNKILTEIGNCKNAR